MGWWQSSGTPGWVRAGGGKGRLIFLYSTPWAEMLIAVVLLAFGGFVEEVVGRVWHECPLVDVCELVTSGGGRDPTRGVEPLDEGGPRQPVATGRPALHSHDLEQEPRNRLRVDEVGVGGGEGRPRPDGADVLRVLPGRAGRTLLHGSLRSGLGLRKWVMICVL
jgi:hypothetical protein